MSTKRKRRKRALAGLGQLVKIRYLGDAEGPMEFVGVRTKTVYKFGGRINLGEVDSRDLGTRHSATPGLFQLLDSNGHKLFEEHVPLEEQAKKKRTQEVWEAAEALALTLEEPAKSKRKAKAKAEESDGESPLPGD